jgi:hypothetical protein
VTLFALPAAITFGQLTSLSGRVLAPPPSHLTVTLQSAPDRGGPWVDAASATVTASGGYSFARLSPASNTYYRVLADGATSATALVSVTSGSACASAGFTRAGEASSDSRAGWDPGTTALPSSFSGSAPAVGGTRSAAHA